MTTSPHLEAVAPAEAPARRELVAATVGTLVEFFDWSLYGVFAPYFAAQLFPGDNALTKTLAAYMTFAVGFFARPVGSVIMGRIADVKGRRFMMTLSVATVALGSLLIAAAPTYTVGGITGAVLVVIARLAMGLSVSGENASSAAYVTETAPRSRRFLYSAISYGGATLGVLLSFVVLTVLLAVFGKDGVTGGAWRIGFLVAALFGLIAVWIRRGVDESAEWAAAVAERPRVLPLLRAEARRMFGCFCLGVGITMSVYFGTVYLPEFAVEAGVISDQAATAQIIIAMVVQLIASIYLGKVADRFGPLGMIRFGLVFLAVVTVPLMSALTSGRLPFLLVACVYVLGAAPALATVNVVGGQLFPVHIRAMAIGVSGSIAIALFGGTFPLVAKAMTGAGHIGWVAWYAAIGAFLSLLASFLIRKSDLRH